MAASETYVMVDSDAQAHLERLDAQRFYALWRRCRGSTEVPQAADVFAELARRYAEPHRHYHTPAHINHCLGQLDLVRERLATPDAVEMALWFHDVVYDPRARDNEQQSAELFRRRARDVLPAAFTDDVYRLIMITRHRETPARDDERHVVDIDLSCFGLEHDAFKRDSNDVRNEFAHLSDADFIPRQCGFLQSLIDRPAIFATEFFRRRYERRARTNIAGHLDVLRSALA